MKIVFSGDEIVKIITDKVDDILDIEGKITVTNGYDLPYEGITVEITKKEESEDDESATKANHLVIS